MEKKMNRKLMKLSPWQDRYGVIWGCSKCTWKYEQPKVGPYGNTSKKSIIAQVKMAFGKHNCLNFKPLL